MGMRIKCAVMLAGGLALLAGCASSAGPAERYQTLDPRQQRDSQLALRLNAEGLKAMQAGDVEKAEEAFRAALAADLFNPSAHNNLGLLLMHEQDKLYEAAWEFEYAAKLLPKSAAPRHNLGSLLERAGRLDSAEAQYTAALALDPDNIEIIGHLARVYIKTDRRDAKLREMLQDLAYRGDGGTWDRWARQWLVRLGEE